MILFCQLCGAKLETEEEIDNGWCNECDSSDMSYCPICEEPMNEFGFCDRCDDD